ncbi:catalase [Endozoicomonas sp. SM1973]|uniref:Catalase n=1 Tax=Spartinivicinus marinus TaxID=2994442 RepID=A0A853IH61_9GAMM|nr:catalase [Spartinivicinus marinus]MCX4029714.1 catalase [Spartinivicinus marinus]NYZ66906.1 catalase [Spartinivicinus marinus]
MKKFPTKLITTAVSVVLASMVNAQVLTDDNGAPIADTKNSLTVGNNGSVLLQDVHLIEKLQRFSRERIPERVMHPRGTGAQGYFLASKDFSKYTTASLFKKGQKTPVLVRFSSVIHSKGSPETARDPRGFAVKFYTKTGNWDLVGNHLPTFFIRDAIKFPDFTHANKPSPVTNLQDPSRFFDFFAKTPEATQTLTWLFSDHGIPASYRTMDGFGVHAFKLINKNGDIKWAKFHWKSHQGIKNLTSAEAEKIQGKDFSHMTRDLYDNIKQGNYPKWDLMVKLIDPKDLDKYDFNIFDDTKQWFDVPEVKVGTLVLDKIPSNFFQFTEMAAYAPSRMIPGIAPSPDKMLQGRLFSYADAQIYRLGTNYQLLPANRPLIKVNNYNIDGTMNFSDQQGDVNYYPSHHVNDQVTPEKDNSAQLQGYMVREEISKPKNFYQAGILYRKFSPQERTNLISNLSGALAQVTDKGIQAKMVSYFYKADHEYGQRLGDKLGLKPNHYK